MNDYNIIGMKIERLLWASVSIAIMACSGDELTKEWNSDSETVVETSLSNVPIQFAPISMRDFFVEAETVTRGGSVDSEDIIVDSVGIFCLAKKELDEAPKEITWTRPYSNDLYNEHLVWTDNEMAAIKMSDDSNMGKIVWSEQYDMHYYPSNAWYTYGFAAYHPWTEYIAFSKSTLTAYIKVDGNDDVICAIADSPDVVFGDQNADVDELSFSKKYYNLIYKRGLGMEGTYPRFEFKHIMSRLDFNFRFDEVTSKNLHVDKVEFDNFYCIMKLELAKLNGTTGTIYNPITTSTLPYVINDDKLKDVKIGGVKLMDLDPKFASAFGHFELREKGETPISGIREGSEYKYNLTTEFKKIGDCVLIPPVQSNTSKRNIRLYVTLCDDNGQKYRNNNAIILEMPSPRWDIGTRYDVFITLNAPQGYGTASAPSLRANSTSSTLTTDDGVALWQPDVKVTITPRK